MSRGEAGAVNALLESLLAALQSGATLAWAIEHAPDGVDPVPAAWAACDSDDTLYALAVEAQRMGRARAHVISASGLPAQCRLGCMSTREARASRGGPIASCRACCDAIRAHMPTLTLAEVVAAARAA